MSAELSATATVEEILAKRASLSSGNLLAVSM